MIKSYINFKSNKGFTLQDLVVAMAIFTMFALIVGSLLVSIFRTQVDSQVDEVATLYAVQIAEYIDKISIDEVNEDLAEKVKEIFGIPDMFNIIISTEDYKPTDEGTVYVKKVKTNIIYSFESDERNIAIERLKIREL